MLIGRRVESTPANRAVDGCLRVSPSSDGREIAAKLWRCFGEPDGRAVWQAVSHERFNDRSFRVP